MRYLLIYLFIQALPLPAQPGIAHTKAFHRDVAPFLAKRCVACHNTKVKNADLNLPRLRDPKEALAERNVLEDVLGKLRNGAMPPPGWRLPRRTNRASGG